MFEFTFFWGDFVYFLTDVLENVTFISLVCCVNKRFVFIVVLFFVQGGSVVKMYHARERLENKYNTVLHSEATSYLHTNQSIPAIPIAESENTTTNN